jgi:hypothetical protein
LLLNRATLSTFSFICLYYTKKTALRVTGRSIHIHRAPAINAALSCRNRRNAAQKQHRRRGPTNSSITLLRRAAALSCRNFRERNENHMLAKGPTPQFPPLIAVISGVSF